MCARFSNTKFIIQSRFTIKKMGGKVGNGFNIRKSVIAKYIDFFYQINGISEEKSCLK